MQYFVIWNDGQKFGPADIQTLNEWIAQGRITPTTELESVVDGSRMQASSLPGLNFSGAAASAGQPADPVAPVEPVSTQTAAPAGGGTQYFVVGADGSKYGPADVPTLSQWAADNRLSPNSELEDASNGVRTTASLVPVLMFPTGAAAAESPISPNQPQSTGYTSAAQQVGNSNYPRADYSDPNAGKVEFIISLILAVVGIPMCGCCGIFNIGAVVLAIMANKKGHPKGKLAIGLSIASFVVGMIYVAISFTMNPAAMQQIQDAMNQGR